MTVEEASTEAIELYRKELTGYCYRMTGSPFEAEDAVQETMVRAWKNLDKFEGRSTLRSWLYTIATNVCLNMLTGAQRKVRPMDFGPSSSADTPIGPKKPELPWLGPIPNAMVLDDPAQSAEMSETIRLAFVAALQHLPAKQRAVLILCEVLKWKAEEAAALLESSVASVNSALQRARATLEDTAHLGEAKPAVLTVEKQDFAKKYAESFEAYDMDALVSLLHKDVVMSMPPFELWLEGPDNVRNWLLGTGKGCQGSRLIQVEANGTTAFGQYRKTADGHEPWALQLIEVENGQVTALTSFLDTPNLFPLFGLPMKLSD